MEDHSYSFLRPQSSKKQFNTKLQPNPRNKNMSCSHFMLKLLLIALFLCVLTLFSSNPPEFISDTVFAQSWELFKLLVVGIALSYGLFCRRKVSGQNGGKAYDFREYKGNVTHHSSVFECNDENVCGSFSKSSDFSSYRNEEYVVVKGVNGEKVKERSLGLPVRSLRSRVVESDSESESFEGNVGPSGWKSRLTWDGLRVEEDEFGMCDARVENFENEWKPRSMWEMYGEKGENFEGNVGPASGWKSHSMREGFVDGKGGSFEGFMGSEAFANGCKPRSMRASFVVGGGEFEMCGEKGENLDENVGPASGWKSQSMREGFIVGDGDFGVHCGRDENFDGYLKSSAFHNGWNPRSVNAGFMEGNGDVEGHGWKGKNFEGNGIPCDKFGFHSREDDNFEGNVGINPSPNEWNSRPVRAGYTAEEGNADLQKSRSMRSDFKVNKGTLKSQLPNSESFRSPIHGEATFGMNPGFCSFLPQSPNMVEGNSWSGVTTVPFQNFHTPENVPNLMGSSAASDFFMPSIATQPSVANFTNDFASGYSNENGSWSTPPIIENTNTFTENPTLFMHSEKDSAQHEKSFIPQTPETRPSIPVASSDLASQRKASKRTRSKLKASGKKTEISGSRVINPVTVQSPMDDVAEPINESAIKKNEDNDNANISMLKKASPLSTPAPDTKSSVKVTRPTNLTHELLVKNKTSKNNANAPSTERSSKNEQRSTPMKWDEDCFVIPSSENNDIEDTLQVAQEDPTPELASLTEIKSSDSPCEEQGLHQNVVEEDVQLKETIICSKIEDLEKEIEPYKPSTTLPPGINILSLIKSHHDMDHGYPSMPKNEKTLSKSSHSRGFSCTSFFDRDLRRSFRNEAREEENRKNEGDDQYAGKAGKCGCLSLDVRPTLSKAALKGKSVRTIRPREISPLEQKSKEQNSEMVVIKIGISEKRPGSSGRKSDAKKGNAGTSIIVGVNSIEGSNGKSKTSVLCDVKEEETVPDSEIDKKADEFIAKFKEQMRLQKVSARQPIRYQR